MRHKPWMLAAMMLALSLGLSACGDDEPVMEDEPLESTEENLGAPPADDSAEEVLMPDTGRDDSNGAATSDEPAGPTSEGAATANDETATVNDETATADEVTDSGQEPATTDEDPLGTDGEPFDADAADEFGAGDTLGDDPARLDDETALPGETSDSDIEAFMRETERRFEEAQRQIDEQFEEVESQGVGTGSSTLDFEERELEPMPNEPQRDEPASADTDSGFFDDEFDQPDQQN